MSWEVFKPSHSFSPSLPPTEHHIRNAILRRMKEQQITQEMLADKLGISQAQISNLIRRKQGTVPKGLISLLDALELELTVSPRVTKNERVSQG